MENATFSFPAETTKVTPAAVARQIAWCCASRLTVPHALSFAPAPLIDMLATRMPSVAALRATQSMPHSSVDSVPIFLLSSTLTA